MEEITITVTRGTSPVRVTGDPIVVDAPCSGPWLGRSGARCGPACCA